MTPQEENARIQQQVNEELRAYSEAQRAATKETEKSAEIEAKVASLTATGLQIMEKLYNAQLKYTIAMAEGKQGAAQFNDGIDAMTEAAQIAAVALSLLVPGGPLIKGVVAGFTFLATQAMKTAAEMQKAANTQADATYKAFSAFSKAGATGSDGLKGFFGDVNRMRLNVRELDQLAGALANSAQEMAGMGGTVFKARQQFADLNQGLRKSEQGFLALGLNNAEVAEASIGFMKMQNTLTLGQQKDYGKLSGAAKKYLEEQEALTRATGFTRKQQEAAQEKFMSQERFGAKIAQLEREGTEESRAVAKRLTSDLAKAASVSDKFAQAYADSVTQMYTSDASVKGLTSTQGTLGEYLNDVLEGRIKSEEESNAGFQKIFKAMDETQENFSGSQLAGATEGFLFDMKTFQTAQIRARNGFDVQMKESKDEVDKLMGTIDGADKQLTRFTKDVLGKQIDDMVALQAQLNGKFSTAGVGVDGFMDIVKNAGTLMMDMVKKGSELLMEMSTLAVNKLREMLGIEGPTAERLETERRDEANSAQTTTGEAVAQAPAKAIEAGGDIAAIVVGAIHTKAGKAVQDLVDTAKKERVNEETEYLATRESRAAQRQVLGFGPGQKAPQTREDYEELDRQRRSPAPAPPAPAPPAVAPAPGGKPPAPAPAPAPGGKPPAPAPAPAPGGKPPAPASIRANQQDLSKSGLTIKKGDVQAPGASISNELLEVAKKIQGSVPGFKYFSGFNDRYHQEESPASLHTQGMAADFVLDKKPSRDEGKQLTALLKSLGATKAIDEYNNRSAKATGGHIHVEVAGKDVQAAAGGVFDGPKSGYAATLHGMEAVIPLKDGAVPVSMSQEFNVTATNLGELVAIMKSNVDMQASMLAVLDEMRRSQNTTADNTGKMVAYASN